MLLCDQDVLAVAREPHQFLIGVIRVQGAGHLQAALARLRVVDHDPLSWRHVRVQLPAVFGEDLGILAVAAAVHVLDVADLVGADTEAHPDEVVVPLLTRQELQFFRGCPERYPGGVGGVHQGEFVGLADDLVLPVLPEPGQIVVREPW